MGVSAIVFDRDERVLLIRRGRPPSAGWWHAPGGRLEPGEALVEACRREVLEETGLDIAVGPILAVVERRLEGFHYIVIDFLGHLQSDPALASAADDAGALAWVASDELAGYPVAEGLLPIIERARQVHRGAAAGLEDRSGVSTDYVAVLVQPYVSVSQLSPAC